MAYPGFLSHQTPLWVTVVLYPEAKTHTHTREAISGLSEVVTKLIAAIPEEVTEFADFIRDSFGIIVEGLHLVGDPNPALAKFGAKDLVAAILQLADIAEGAGAAVSEAQAAIKDIETDLDGVADKVEVKLLPFAEKVTLAVQRVAKRVGALERNSGNGSGVPLSGLSSVTFGGAASRGVGTSAALAPLHEHSPVVDSSGTTLALLGDLHKRLEEMQVELNGATARIATLEATIKSEGGVVFEDFAFASEEDVAALVEEELPHGKAIGAFLDFITIFFFDPKSESKK